MIQLKHNVATLDKKIKVIYSPTDYKIAKPILSEQKSEIDVNQIFDDYLKENKQ